MKRRLIPLLLATSLLTPVLQGCYGQFALTRKLYQWNGSVGDKWVNAIIFMVMNIIPVYSLTVLADGLVINTIEFWSGKNPITMASGERDSRLVSVAGRDYVITATRNRLDIVPAQGGLEVRSVTYVPEERAWYLEEHGQRSKIAEQDEAALTLLLPDGRRETVAR